MPSGVAFGGGLGLRVEREKQNLGRSEVQFKLWIGCAEVQLKLWMSVFELCGHDVLTCVRQLPFGPSQAITLAPLCFLSVVAGRRAAMRAQLVYCSSRLQLQYAPLGERSISPSFLLVRLLAPWCYQ